MIGSCKRNPKWTFCCFNQKSDQTSGVPVLVSATAAVLLLKLWYFTWHWYSKSFIEIKTSENWSVCQIDWLLFFNMWLSSVFKKLIGLKNAKKKIDLRLKKHKMLTHTFTHTKCNFSWNNYIYWRYCTKAPAHSEGVRWEEFTDCLNGVTQITLWI